MNKNVRKAVETLREEFGGDSYIPDTITVDADALLTLLEWAEKKRNADPTSALEVGDRVKLKIDWLAKTYTRKGAKGTVTRLNGMSNQDYPYAVTMDKATDEHAVSFARAELKRI